MHGRGREVCPECKQSIKHCRDLLATRELRGPRNINPSDIDRIFDDGGKRFLVIEEKNEGEAAAEGQKRLLRALSQVPQFDVWLVQGKPDNLTVSQIRGNKLRRLGQGGMDEYQRLVDGWFAQKAPVVHAIVEDARDLEWRLQAGVLEAVDEVDEMVERLHVAAQQCKTMLGAA